MNDGAYIASPQETICVTEQECGEVVHVVPADEAAGTAVSLTGKPEDETVYPGSFVIYKSEEGLLVVNELDLEMYLRYVVPSEMPSSYEKEALKAQAVCARTYACARIREKTWENYHADVDDSVETTIWKRSRRQTLRWRRQKEKSSPAAGNQFRRIFSQPPAGRRVRMKCGIRRRRQNI